MRTTEQIDKIKKTFSDPYIVHDFITPDDVAHLIKLFDEDNTNGNIDPNQSKVYKNTGPVTLDIHKYLNDPVVDGIIKQLKLAIGNFEITAGFFFFTNYPHIIHNDDLFQLPDTIYKGITIPLRLDAENIVDYSNLCFFDQHYFHGPSKFFKGSKDIPTYYNKQVYDYSNVDGLLEYNPIDDELYQKYFTHLKREWLEGLSLHSVLPWKPGSCIIFDSLQLHCASDFRKHNIKSKLGISIFTKL